MLPSELNALPPDVLLKLAPYKLVTTAELQQLRDDQEAVDHLRQTLLAKLDEENEEICALRAQVASLKQQIVEQAAQEKQRLEELEDMELQVQAKREALLVKEAELRERDSLLRPTSVDETIERLSGRVRELEAQLREDTALQRLAEREADYELTHQVQFERIMRLKQALAEKEEALATLKKNSLPSLPSFSEASVASTTSPSNEEEFQRLVRSFILAVRKNDTAMKQALMPALCALSNMAPEDTRLVLKGITPLPRI